MTIPEHSKFRLAGFSGWRVAYVLAVGSFFLVPAHVQVSCEASGAIFGISLVAFLITFGLTFTSPQTTPHRFLPAVIALFAVVTHMLCTH
ncbi:MAG TPA: hypothetical protein VN673_05590 [Clostridia bacterium]|nr:hypothetical protein [Clostridia bacterium]